MTAEQITALGPAFTNFLGSFFGCFLTRTTFKHVLAYCRGLLSDLPRKSVEPIALAGGTAVRTLQEMLTHHRWDHGLMRDEIQRRIVREHLPAPGGRCGTAGGLGIVGIIDETSVAKKGDKTPGVQHQYCGASGKEDNCLVTVHLAIACDEFRALLDSDLYLPETTWHEDRARCREAHIPDTVVYRAKWQIGIEQVKRAMANGVRFDWITFDEGYGGKPPFLYELDALGQIYVGEVPPQFRCWPTLPPYQSLQAPFAAKRVDNAAIWGKPFLRQPWQRFSLKRQSVRPQQWDVKAAQVWLQTPVINPRNQCRPTVRTYWLIVARNVATGEIKYFVSNAPPQTSLKKLLRVAFCRWGIEHLFRVAKSEIGLGHYEGRNYQGLMRHMTLCKLTLLFVAEQTTRLREKKSRVGGANDGADGAGAQHAVPLLAGATLQMFAN
jgi:SRSO17 transposase